MATAQPQPNSNLSQALRGECEALSRDVHQANALAADFQRHAPGQSNELAVLKQIFEKAQEDLARLEASISGLREERHTLANEAMRAMALERKLAEVTAERDRLRAEGDAMRKGLIASAEDTARRKRETDAQIARMAVELGTLRHRGADPAPPPTPSADADIRAALAQISATLERLTTQLAQEAPRSTPPRSSARSNPASEPAIDIAFDP